MFFYIFIVHFSVLYLCFLTFSVLALIYIFYFSYYVYSYARKNRGKFDVCVNLLGNEPHSVFTLCAELITYQPYSLPWLLRYESHNQLSVFYNIMRLSRKINTISVSFNTSHFSCMFAHTFLTLPLQNLLCTPYYVYM